MKKVFAFFMIFICLLSFLSCNKETVLHENTNIDNQFDYYPEEDHIFTEEDDNELDVSIFDV